MNLFTTIASYALCAILILLVTFGQEVPAQWQPYVRDGIQAGIAFLLFLADPAAFVKRVESGGLPAVTTSPVIAAPQVHVEVTPPAKAPAVVVEPHVG